MQTSRTDLWTHGGKGWEVGRRIKREGTYVYLWLIHVDIWQRPTQYCKVIFLQLKISVWRKKTFLNFYIWKDVFLLPLITLIGSVHPLNNNEGFPYVCHPCNSPGDLQRGQVGLFIRYMFSFVTLGFSQGHAEPNLNSRREICQGWCFLDHKPRVAIWGPIRLSLLIFVCQTCLCFL